MQYKFRIRVQYILRFQLKPELDINLRLEETVNRVAVAADIKCIYESYTRQHTIHVHTE